MPLIRYELQNQYSLASRELFSAAPVNNPNATLEAVAVAGLVGVVRQLGNLAEFAADIFRELHDVIIVTAARGQCLILRVQRLEAELPVIEQDFLRKSSWPAVGHKTGFKWHGSTYIHQKDCFEEGLPQFVENSYNTCRGLPMFLFWDKFDISGAGACQKRYSDPSFFKRQRAISELKIAERDERAQQNKEKINHCGNVKVEGNSHERWPPFSWEELYSSSCSETSENHSEELFVGANDRHKADVQQYAQQNHERKSLKGVAGKNTNGIEQKIWPQIKLRTLRDFFVAEDSLGYLKISAKSIEVEALSSQFRGVKMTSELEHKVEQPVEEEMIEDISSEDQFVDAMTTMDSETYSDSKDRKKMVPELMDTREPTKVSAILGLSDDHGLEKEQDDLSIQKMDHIAHHHVEGVDSQIFTDLAYSTSTSCSLNYSTDKEENVSTDYQAQTNNRFWHLAEIFARKVTGISARQKVVASPFCDQIVPRSEKHKIASALEEVNDLATRHVRHKINSIARKQSSESSHNESFLERDGWNSSTALPSTMPNKYFIEQPNSSLSIQSEDPAIDCCIYKSHDSPPSARQPSVHQLSNPRVAEVSLNCSDDDAVSPQPPTFSDSSHSSSSVPTSPTSDMFQHVGADAEPNSTSASSPSISSSPKLPIFSALDSPVSIRAPTLRSLSPTFVVPELLSSPILKSTPPPHLPVPPLKWNTNQALHSASGFPPPLPPLPPPPPPPPPRTPSKLVRSVPQVKLASRSLPHPQRHDDLIKSISTYDRSKLRKVTPEKGSSKPKDMDEREILLQQIKNKTFKLRHVAVEKHDASTRQKPDIINVAALLKKANAIREAFDGSDEDKKEWTEMHLLKAQS